MSAYLSQLNFCNYMGAKQILIQPDNIEVTVYVDIVSAYDSSRIFLTKDNKFRYNLVTEDDYIYLNDNSMGLCRGMRGLTKTDLLNMSVANYAFVQNMHSMFGNCSKLTGQPAIAPSVADMYGTYFNDSKLSGQLYVGADVTNLIGTYYNCVNIIGSPVSSDNIISMKATYYNCSKLTGHPVCGTKVQSLEDTYYNCYLLSGNPPNCNNVRVAINAYYNCVNLYGDFYWYSDSTRSGLKINACNMFYHRNYSNKLNIYVKKDYGVENALINYASSSGLIYGGSPLEWTILDNTGLTPGYIYYNNAATNTNVIAF